MGEREGDFGDNSRVEILANLPFLEGELSRREWKHKTFHFEVTSRENKAKLKRTIVHQCSEHFGHW